MTDSDSTHAGIIRRRRFTQWVWLLVGLCATLAWLAWAGHGIDQRNAKPWLITATGWIVPVPSLTMIWLAALANFVLLSVMAWLLHTTDRVPNAIKLKPWLSVLMITVLAVSARCVIISTWAPTLSDDHFRYRHDGHSVLAGENVYRLLPQDQDVRVTPFALTLDREPRRHQPDLLDRFSNIPFQPTVYLPVNQLTFAMTAAVEKALIRDNRLKTNEWPQPRNTAAWDLQLLQLSGDVRLLPYRIVHTLADLATLFLLMALLVHHGRSIWWAALYGLNPLVLIEVAGNGHLDPVGYVFVLAALLAYAKKRANLAAVMIGLGILCKPLAALVLPAILLHQLRQANGGSLLQKFRLNPWPTVRLIVVCLLTVLLGFVPFAAGLTSLQTTLSLVAHSYHFNGPLFDLVRWLALGGNSTPVRPILGGLHLVVQIVILVKSYRRDWPVAVSVLHAMTAFLVFSPQVYPWYVLWALALVPLAWHAGTWLLSLTVLSSYSVWIVYRSTGEWEQPNAVLLLAWVPVLVLSFWALFRQERVAPKMLAVTDKAES